MKNIKELGLEAIELEDQVLLVDPKPTVKKDDGYCWDSRYKKLVTPEQNLLTGTHDADFYWKIISSTKPLEGLPLLVIEDEDVFVFNTLSYQIKEFLHSISFRKGFRKAKETYKFTEEDIVEFLNWVGNDGYPCIDKSKKGLWVLHPQEPKDFTVKELLQIWKEQRTKKELYVEVEEKHFRTVKNNEGQLVDHQFTIEPKITDNKIKAKWL